MMNHLPSKSINGVLTHSSFYNAARRLQQTSRIHAPRAGTSRLKSTRSDVPPAKSTTSGPTHNQKINASAAPSAPGRASSEPKESSNGVNNEPLPYQNTPSAWTDSSFLTPYMRKYPALYRGLKFFYDGMGLYAKQGDSVRLGKKIYMTCCERDVLEEAWVYDTCGIPRTFHTWFQLTNLHVWLLTVRLRSLPPPYGRLTLQALVDFFFQDIEDRLRSLLGPRTSERTITGYMKEYRELWNGSTLALDIGLVGGDWELAGAVWRNCFDARGWDLGGIRGEDGHLVSSPGSSSLTATSTPTPTSPSPLGGHAGGSSTGALSGKSPDQALAEIPIHVYSFVAYLRRELKRLEDIPDETIIQEMDIGEWGKMQGTGRGDDMKNAPITKAEVEKWTKAWEEIGSYR